MPQDSEQLKKAREYAFLLLKFRPRSINEFREKLNKHGFSEDVIDKITADFKKRGLLDDAKFAKMWLADRMNLKPMGKLKLRQELKEKGISEFDIDDTFESAKNEIDEYESARKLAQNRLRQMKGLHELTMKRRLAGFLSRRGFSYSVVAKVVREALKDES